ncbi:MAG: DUF4328 domain-containing protein [Bacteroidia bacterium]
MYYIKLHNNQKLHRYLRISLWMLLAAYAINLPVSWITAEYMGGMATDPMAIRENIGLFIITGIISLITGLAGLVFPVLFIIWMYRAYENLQKINPALTDHQLGWTIGAWFVPVLNFFRPYHIIAEIWNKTQRAMRNEGEQYNHEPQTQINLWWGTWMGGVLIAIIGAIYMMSNTLGRISSMRSFQRFDTQEIMQENITTSLIINGVAAVFYLAALVFLGSALKKIAPIEEGLAERVDRKGYGQWGTQQGQQSYPGQNY